MKIHSRLEDNILEAVLGNGGVIDISAIPDSLFNTTKELNITIDAMVIRGVITREDTVIRSVRAITTTLQMAIACQLSDAQHEIYCGGTYLKKAENRMNFVKWLLGTWPDSLVNVDINTVYQLFLEKHPTLKI